MKIICVLMDRVKVKVFCGNDIAKQVIIGIQQTCHTGPTGDRKH